MPAYKVRVVDPEGRLVVGATIYCNDDAAAQARFAELPLPAGLAELSARGRVLATRGEETIPRAASGEI